MNYQEELQKAGWKYKDGSRAVGDFANPTLEELIEACETNRGYFRLEQNGAFWHAKIHGSKIGWKKGKTPATATARLWLALHPIANN